MAAFIPIEAPTIDNTHLPSVVCPKMAASLLRLIVLLPKVKVTVGGAVQETTP